MRAKTILTVLFLISLGVVAALYLESLPKRVDVRAAAAHETLVATMPLPPGTLLRAEDVVWKRIAGSTEPGEILRPSAAAHDAQPDVDEQARSDIYGAALRVGLALNEPIHRNTIVKPGDRDFLRLVLAPGARAITIPVAAGRASTGLLFAGDRVDVILTQTFKNDTPLTRRSVSETVVEGRRILAIDANARALGANNGFERGVTLEVTPDQAEEINVATELGKLSLSLRGISDAGEVMIASMSGLEKPQPVKPTWAGDVSPALGGVMPPEKLVSVGQPPVEILRGTKREVVKLQ